MYAVCCNRCCCFGVDFFLPSLLFCLLIAEQQLELIATAANSLGSTPSISTTAAVPASISFINLKLILVSGRTREFNFSASTSAADIASMFLRIGPENGKRSSVTLSALSLPGGKTTVMHLVTRENLPEPNSNDNLKKSKRSACCRCCVS
uniref:UBL3-like ubiquitin domain-containing protein n=1 Tax=Ditylenchus dipsaci TaxID=166011 RepID=A0A915CTK0_9BILA